jgi:hypothetical protein
MSRSIMLQPDYYVSVLDLLSEDSTDDGQFVEGSVTEYNTPMLLCTTN